MDDSIVMAVGRRFIEMTLQCERLFQDVQRLQARVKELEEQAELKGKN